jgi:hypothetical protein
MSNFHDLDSTLNIIMVTKITDERGGKHRMFDAEKNVYTAFMVKPEGKRASGRARWRSEDIKTAVKEMRWVSED